ncbi:MAG: tRNA pseudouridine(38-40) synthase TruA [Bacteroidetes bacterium]|nr:tRNA pseudouridine(38-40) synthase TruA [Bacteroidota bacterium]
MVEEQRRRFRVRIEYDGTDFVGWQLQPNGRSVQGEMELALQRLFQQSVRVHGAGRTDAGVHATGQVAHFDLHSRLDAGTVTRALNAELPLDITIRETVEVDPEFHARFTASSRSYEYTIVQERISLDRRQQWILYASLDHDAIRQVVDALRGTHDFTTFSKHVASMPHHYCHVFDASWESDELVSRFRIRANRFLQGMVRCLVGGIVHVGRQRITPKEFISMLAARDRGRAPMLAPAHGLVLTEVGYSEDERAQVNEIMNELRMAREMEE